MSCGGINKGKDTKKLCEECAELLSYAKLRLENCPFQERKTTCGKCPIHCYKPKMRKKIQEVMRIVGPGLILSHPIISIQHLLDGLRKHPVKTKKDSSG